MKNTSIKFCVNLKKNITQFININIIQYNKFSKKYYINNFISTNIIPNYTEPKEYRILYIENLNPNWNKIDIESRVKRLGSPQHIHLIKNTIGEFTGKSIVVFDNIKSVALSIEKMNWKVPFSEPVKAKFYRYTKYPCNEFFNKKVLAVTNVPESLRKRELLEYLQSFSKCIHIAYPRTNDDKFKHIAIVYFLEENEAEKVYNKLHMRYVNNKQLIVRYCENYSDISDFRYNIENKVNYDHLKIDNETSNFDFNLTVNTNSSLSKKLDINLLLDLIHRKFLIKYIESNIDFNKSYFKNKVKDNVNLYNNIVNNELEKLSYYNLRCGFNANKDVLLLKDIKDYHLKIGRNIPFMNQESDYIGLDTNNIEYDNKYFDDNKITNSSISNVHKNLDYSDDLIYKCINRLY